MNPGREVQRVYRKDHKITITCYGVRGSVSATNESRLKYGCNTSCIKVEAGDKVIILDAGTGLLRLGETLSGDDGHIILLLSHYHYDHIEGLTYFDPLYSGRHVDLYGCIQGERGIREHLDEYVKAPFSPRSIQEFSDKVHYMDVKGNDVFQVGEDICIKTQQLNHPNGSMGYRIEYYGKSVVYMLDNEVGNEIPESQISFYKDADLVIWDSHFTQEEYDSEKYIGWGHSTHEQGVELAKAANVKQILFTHHAPWRTDEELDEIEEKLKAEFEGVIVAKEETEITI